MALNSKMKNKAKYSVIDRVKENFRTMLNGYVGSPLTYTKTGWDLTINAGSFILDGILFEETGGSIITVNPSTSSSRTDIIVIKKTIDDTYRPVGYPDVIPTITNYSYVYKSNTTAVLEDEILFIKIDIPANAVSLLESTISTLQKSLTLKEVYAELETVKDDIEEIKTTNTSQNTSINNLSTRIGDAENDIESLQTQITGLQPANQEARISTVEGDISNIKAEQIAQNTNISNVSGRVGTVETDLSNLQIQVNNLDPADQSARLTTIETDISSIKTEQTTQNTDINNLKTTTQEHTTSLTDLDTRLIEVESFTGSYDTSAIDTLNMEIVDIKIDLSQQQADINSLQSSVASITDYGNEINLIKTKNTSQDTEINGVKTRITTAEGKITTLQADVTALKQGGVTADLDVIHQDITNIKSEQITQNTNITNLQNQVNNIEGQISGSEVITAMQTDIDNLETSVANINNVQIPAINQNLTELNSQLQSAHTHTNLEVLEGITQEDINQIGYNKTSIESLNTTIQGLEGSVGNIHTHPYLTELNTLTDVEINKLHEIVAGYTPRWGEPMDALAREWARRAIIQQMKDRVEYITDNMYAREMITKGFCDTFTDDSGIWPEYSNMYNFSGGAQGYISSSVDFSNLNAVWKGQYFSSTTGNILVNSSSAIYVAEHEATYYVVNNKICKMQDKKETVLCTIPFYPSTTTDISICYVPDINCLVVYGGRYYYNSSTTYYNKIMKVDLLTNVATDLTGATIGTGPSVSAAGLVYDKDKKKILLSGGSNGSYVSSIYTVDPFTWTFEQISAQTLSNLSVCWFDNKTGLIYRFGGMNTGNGLYFFDWTSKLFVEVATPTNIGTRYSFSSAYVPNYGFFIFGGYYKESPTGTSTSVNEMWLYDGTDWKQITLDYALINVAGFLHIDRDPETQLNYIVINKANGQYNPFHWELTTLNNPDSVVTFRPLETASPKEAILLAEGEGFFSFEVSFDNGNTFIPINYDGNYIDLSSYTTGAYAILRVKMASNAMVYSVSFSWI